MPSTPATKPEAPAPLAYSYIRFSTPEQAKGDSLRRQTEAAIAWCVRNGVKLDTSLTFRDLGKSAYLGEHRKNPDRYALAAFLKLVEDGKVPRGSFLLIESLDRLTREHVRAGLMLLLGLIESGIRIVQLSPSELVYDEKSDEMGLMLAIVELSRGHRESKRKSDMLSAAWVKKRQLARQKGTVLTRQLPGWVEEVDGEPRLIPERAAVVQRIFRLAASGYGSKLTAVLFNRENVPAFGPSGHWNGSYIRAILLDRRALGEFQPHRNRGRKPDGDPIPNYFPAVVTEKEWNAARAGAAQRRHKPGRVSKHVNVFAGLLKNARSGDTYYCQKKPPSNGRGRAHVVLMNAGAAEGRTPCYSFPFIPFEAAILKCLKEVHPREILSGDDGPDETLVLAGQLAGVEARIADLEAELLHGEVAALARVLRQLEAQKRELAEKLAAARQKAATPLAEAWGEAKSLMDVLDSAPNQEDLRLRLRAALRRGIDSLWLLVAGRGKDRLCGAQVWLQGGEKFRNYWILYRPPKANQHGKNTSGQVWVESIRYYHHPDTIDLRKREGAEWALEQLLYWNPEREEGGRFLLKGTIIEDRIVWADKDN